MNKRRILLVDDEPAFTRVMRNYLEATGRFEVRMENDPTKVIPAALEFAPDLIVLDVIMPDVDGGEIAAMMREDTRLRDVPVVFLTAIVSKEFVGHQGEVIGGQTYLAKPVDAQELVKCVERKLAKAA